MLQTAYLRTDGEGQHAEGFLRLIKKTMGVKVMSIWFYFTIIIAILAAQDLFNKKIKNQVRLKELEIERLKLELEKQTAEEAAKLKQV